MPIYFGQKSIVIHRNAFVQKINILHRAGIVSLAIVRNNTVFVETETKILTNLLLDYSFQDNLTINSLSNITALEGHTIGGF
jgi:hypothetical protein